MKEALLKVDKESIEKEVRRLAVEQKKLMMNCLMALTWDKRREILDKINEITILLITYRDMLRNRTDSQHKR